LRIYPFLFFGRLPFCRVQFVNALKNGGAPFLAEPKPSIVDSIVDAFSSLTRPLRSLLFDGGRLSEARWLRWRAKLAQK
jgi:hypothetical protein